MKRCPYCDRTLNFWQFKCRLCNRFIWRIPQILIVAAAFLLLIFVAVLIVDYIAVSREPIEKKNGQQPGAVRERPRYF